MAAFCAAAKTDEKKPPAASPLEELGERVPRLLASSIIGVSGADMTLDSLLGDCVAESDLTRRCEIMLPDGDVMVLGFFPADIAPLVPNDGLPGGSISWSVGVGGVTCVWGASRPALVGVLGVVTIVGSSLVLEVGLLGLESMDCVLSEAFVDLPKLILPLLSLLNSAPRAPPDFTELRSGLFGGLLLSFFAPVLKTSLILAPGETPLLLLPSAVLRVLPPSLVSIVAACWGARFDDKEGVLVVSGSVLLF